MRPAFRFSITHNHNDIDVTIVWFWTFSVYTLEKLKAFRDHDCHVLNDKYICVGAGNSPDSLTVYP